MTQLTRREALAVASGIGAVLVWAHAPFASAVGGIVVRPEHFLHGVGSGDPTPDSVVLWTRYASDDTSAAHLRVEVALDDRFEEVVARAHLSADASSDWTCRALVGGLTANTSYWYKFIDREGGASRTGRTRTAPHPDDTQAVRFAFVSCQDVPLGYCTPYRRMVHEDISRPFEKSIQFVLHLGDFIYDEVWYRADRPHGFLGRSIRDLVRFPHGALVEGTRVPVTVDDYRALYKAYLLDPDLQDARARWPFVCVWDNHEFSSPAWQSASDYATTGLGAQSRRAAANQAWFEYIPARVTTQRGAAPATQFVAPAVADTPLNAFDADGLSHEPNNLAAINSLIVYRTLKFGRNVDLIITDNRSYRSEPAANTLDAQLASNAAPFFTPTELIARLDAGGGPSQFGFDGSVWPNRRASFAKGTMLGREQKAWFLERLRRSNATWKLWGNSVGALERRADLHNLPPNLRALWRGAGYGTAGGEDWGGYPHERAEILDALKLHGISNVASLSGDRHQYFAGVLSASLPPDAFEPVAIEFGGSSISTPTLFEAAEYITRRSAELRALYACAVGGEIKPSVNLTLKHGVASSLKFAETGSEQAALAVSNPEVAPHLTFTDSSCHGYIAVRASAEALDVEIIGLPKPITQSEDPAGDPLVYRIGFRVPVWRSGEAPRLERTVLEGELPLGSFVA